MKKILIIMIIILLAACGKSEEKPVENKEVLKSVKTMELKKSKVENIKNYNGELIPLNEVAHTTDTGGDVTKINYQNGDFVKKGEIVLVLKDKDTEAAYLESMGEFMKAQSDYETSKTSYGKYKTLFDKKLISEDAFLTMKNQFIQSEGAKKVVQSQYLKAKQDFDELTVRAKISGLVSDLDIKKYQKTAADETLFTVVDASKMEVGVGVAASDLQNIKKGSTAKVYVDDIGAEITGTVEKINPASDSDTKKYEAKILLNNKDGKLVKGMYSKVEVNSGEVEGFFIPKEAIMLKDMYNYIAVSREGQAIIYKVDLGISSDDSQQIVFDDYLPGDKVIIQGQYLLKNNDKIKEA
ncbi:efflux RND transporter periplasmic adaptor subunit [uncultured Ilyobacter sp.]|uniref:efflux RND transporter periplasmic adaptor subunit n=1 Tax=uncultured Ilyobacter sp. TaxID=544433 RepID=UPI0029F58171|nr:efflux RND transporter periplasmic adaptor subunit [uncultured Ilyobacter sp.]